MAAEVCIHGDAIRCGEPIRYRARQGWEHTACAERAESDTPSNARPDDTSLGPYWPERAEP